MGRRIGAWVIDSVIATIVFVIVFLTILTKLELPNSDAASRLCDVVNNGPGSNICVNFGTTVYGGDGGDIAAIWLSMLAFFFIFHVVLPSITGYSPGKGMVGLRIVKQESFQTAGFGANIVRWLMWIVDSVPFIVPLVGLITGLASKGHRRVGDMVASTLVVDKASVGTPMPVPGVNSVTAGAPGATPPPPTNWTPPPPTTPPPTPPATPPTAAPPPSDTGFAPPGAPDAAPPTPSPDSGTTAIDEPPAPSSDEPPADEPPAAPVEEAPIAEQQTGVDAPQWDAARNTYIQWDPELREWMEWNEGQGRWIPISR